MQHHSLFAPTAPARAPAAVFTLPVMTLARLQRLMQYEGKNVDLPRLCIDTAYAYDCLATAHASSDERLRRLALELFDAFGRNSEPGAVH